MSGHPSGIRHGSSPNEDRSAAGGFLHDEKEEPTVDVTMSFPKWCACLTSQVLRTRTAFSKFFVDSLSSQSSPLAPSPALFPLALPGGFPKMIPGASSRLRRRIHFERVVYIMVLALNYWHFGGSFIPFEVLRRKPSSQQINVHKRLRGFLKSEAVAGTFKISAAGRKFPQLSARLAELSSAVTFLGLSGSPYTKAFQGAEVAVNNSVMEELEPYRSLDASRLKLSGSGLWDITPWLPDELVMAYREPASIYIDRSPHPGEYPRMSDSPEELNRLAKVWDARGLLYLHHEEIPDHEQVRIFNCYKGPLIDRQIGDRRGRNAKERRLCGPSSQLPSAVDILDLIVAEDESLYISCSDRKDFYHQVWSSERRSLTNSLGPPLPAEWLTETKAYGAYCLKYSKKKYNRSAHGDRLGMGLPVFEKAGNANLRVAFSSILQGDHGGVEFATASHEQLLKSHGCLDFTTRALASRPLFDPKVADGLVIDDYFAVSVEKHQTPKENTTSHYLHQRALQAYANEELLGSPEKDVVAENFGKVIGAQLNSSPMARRNGLTLASSATEKRIALSWISLQIAQLRRTTDQLHLCLTGGWVSSLLFRRPAMSILDKIFHVVGDDYTAAGEPKILHVSGQVADELTLLAVLMPLFQSDLSAPLCPSIFASDASIERGAIVEAEISPGIAGLLHRACKSKGSYTKLAPRGSLLLREVDDDEWDNPGIDVPGPSRPPAFKYHFIELFAGAARVTDHLQQMGFVCGPPIDISWSEEYDLRYHHVMSWVSYMLCEGRLDGVMTEPPCTTFSVMRRPALRDRDFPFGFEPHHSQTMVGNELALRGFQTLHFADAYDAAALLETPNSSKMKNLPSWGHLRDRPNFNMVRCDSCRFGSPHLKSFKFLGVNIKMDLLAKRCCCTTKHLQVQGQYTKKSATYTEDLAHSLALAFSEAILAVHRRREYLEEIEVDGKENILVNEVAKTARWKVNGDWAFKSKSHINLLELSAVVELARRVAKRFGSCRVLALVDSIVVRGACSKGRSASKGISRLLRRFCSICVAAGLYFTTPYCPTRLNTSDDPTRGRPIRDRQPDAWLSEWSPEDLYRLATKQTLRRWASNWCSLIIKLLGSKVVYFNDRSLFRGFPLRSSQLHWGGMDFDATLGYPGEGPLLRFRSALIAFSWILRSSVSVFCFLPVCLVLSRGGGVMAMPITARNPRDTARARTRDGVELIPGRQVLPVTNSMRASLMAAFRAWTEEELVPWDELMANAHLYVDEINAVIVRFGRCLFQIGRPYNHYAETINAIATEKPSIRRLLQPAWNLAFGWLQREPNVHHVCMPAQVLLALLTVALMWGWDRVAGCLGLGWGALLRAGELISATRSQLLLPSDVFFSANFCLVSILEPKTRFTAARHQSAKLDSSDLVALAELAFADLHLSQRLWPYSGQTLRTRLRKLLSALWLPTVRTATTKPLDVGSLRAGGATWLLQTTEDAELTRRRGRWINAKTMEIYIQEIQATSFFTSLPSETRRRIVGLSLVFPEVLQKCIGWKAAKIPSSSWHILFQH